MTQNKRNMPSVKNFEDFFVKYKIDGYITANDLPDLSPYATSGDLDSYVKTADIVNDITSGGTAKPLSAEQGKTLAGLSLYAGDPYGSNSNGEYIKYEDGTMMCWGSGSESSATFSGTGSVYYRNLSTYTFPATFYAAPQVFVNCAFANVGMGVARNIGTTTFGGWVMSAVSSARSIAVGWFAIGRWKA